MRTRAAMILESASVGAILAVAAAVWLQFDRVTRGFRLEDGFITFRYAENLALGHGFVFNVGERVLGTTTPLLGLVLALLGFLFGPARIPACASVVLLLASLCMAIFVYRMFRRSFSWGVSLLGMSLVLLHPVVTWVTVGGMETPLVLLFMAVSLFFLQRGRWIRMGVSLGLLLLTRPDGALWSALLLASAGLRERRALGPALLACAAVIAPWILFATLYYGSPIPHSVVAKLAIPIQRQGVSGASLSRYGQLLVQNTGIEMRGRILSMEFLEFFEWISLVVAGVWLAVRPGITSPFLTLVVFVPLLWGGLAFSGLESPFPWYPVPAIWACLMLAALGLMVLVSTGLTVGRDRARSRVVGVTLSVLVLGTLSYRTFKEQRVIQRYDRAVQEHADAVNKSIGLWLAEHTPVSSTVATEAIGYEGYYSRRRVLDLAGLVSPEVVRLARESRTHAELFARVCSELKPDYLVLRAFEIERNQSFFGGPLFRTDAERAAFFQHYGLVRRFSHPHPIPLVSEVLVFVRSPGG